MAITKEQIFAAAEKLMESGTNPTLSNVRKALGSGSFSTISDAMSEWRATQKAPEAPIRELAPERLNERLQELGSEIWSIALEIATGRLKAEREALETARQEMELQQAETAEMADQLAEEVEQLRKEKSDLKAEVKIQQESMASLESLLQSERTENASLKAELSASEKWNVDLHEKIDRLETNITGKINEINEQRILMAKMENDYDHLNNKYHKEETQAEAWKQEASQLRSEIQTYQTQITTAATENGKLIGELKAVRDQLEELKKQQQPKRQPAKNSKPGPQKPQADQT